MLVNRIEVPNAFAMTELPLVVGKGEISSIFVLFGARSFKLSHGYRDETLLTAGHLN